MALCMYSASFGLSLPLPPSTSCRPRPGRHGDTVEVPLLFRLPFRTFSPPRPFSQNVSLRMRAQAPDAATPAPARPAKTSKAVKPPKKQKDDPTSTLRALSSKSRAPKRWLGQHYMVNQEVTDKTVQAAHIQPGDVVLEVGPGTGALTQVLLDSGARVIAVEKDPDMASLVQERFADCDDVEVVEMDFLKWHVAAHMREALQSQQSTGGGEGSSSSSSSSSPQGGSTAGTSTRRCKLVANLPFNITSDVVYKMLPLGDLFSSVVLMLQDEAAQRLVLEPASKSEFRRMSLFVQFYSNPVYNFYVPRKDFLPPPNVDAAVVTFKLKRSHELPAVASTRGFFSMVNAAFMGKRKMLRNSLTTLYPADQVARALAAADLAPTSRPDELSLEQFLLLFNTLSAAPTDEGGVLPGKDEEAEEPLSPADARESADSMLPL
eukprot:jgi/Mesen1/7093/ME000369S06415